MNLPSSRRAARVAAFSMAVLCGAVVGLAGCSVDTIYIVIDGGPPGADAGTVDQSADLTPSTDLGCTPEVQSCTGLCGPVRDNCTGQTFQCGGCATGTVCDLDGHTCIVPKADCKALNKVCGTTKNSCGETISCDPFTCADAQHECDPNTNECVACTAVTCEDLGYQCGNAWLGCGPSTNTTDCGTCPASQVCNNALHVCEPSNGGVCGGMTPAQLCAAAALSDGVQCGNISNGCGDLINCTTVDPTTYTCRAGTTCGGAGIPNQCAPAEPPTECIADNFNCGTLPSACGGTISCGQCDATMNQVCIIAQGQTAGVCGALCNMPQKTCNTDYSGMCGNQLDNNCWPNKLDCPCPPGDVCSSTKDGVAGTCSVPVACGKYTMGASGQPCSTTPSTAFPEGNGTNLTCPCANSGTTPGTEVCTMVGANGAGTCCVRDACTGTEASVVDHCTGMTLSCCAPNQKVYNNMCCTPKTACPADNDYDVLDDGCGGTYTCTCGRFGLDDPKTPPTTEGGSAACCAVPTCGTQCGGTVTSACSGKSTATCTTKVCNGAGSGQTTDCVGDACCYATRTCTPGIYEIKTDSCGVQYTCGCAGAVIPRDVNGDPVDGAHCCTAPAACGTDCAGDTKHTTCTASDTTVVPDKSQAPNVCDATVCTNTQCCKAGSCITATACASGQCGTIDNGCGMQKTCACSGGTQCVGSMCECPTPTCSGCNPPTQTNACGKSVDCSCTISGQTCGVADACCTPKSCANLPAGQACGAVSDSCTGNTISCGCNPGNMPNAICSSTGQCECTPTKCCKDTGGVTPCLQPGPYGNDGCGTAGSCSS